MLPDSLAAELARLLDEVSRLEAELKSISLRDTQALNEHLQKIRQLRLKILKHRNPRDRPSE